MSNPECPICLEEVDELISSSDEVGGLMCPECLEHIEFENVLYEEECRQSEEDAYFEAGDEDG